MLAAGQDEEVEGEEPAALESDIEDALDDELDAVEDVLDAAATAGFDVVAGDYASASKNVQPVLISDAKEELTKAVAKQEEKIAKQEAEVAKVKGLTSAIATYESALKSKEAAQKAADKAELEADGEIAKFEKVNETALAGDEYNDLVEQDDDGVWVVKSTVTAKDWTGIC